MLANVHNYCVMVKSMSCCCICASWLFSNPVTHTHTHTHMQPCMYACAHSHAYAYTHYIIYMTIVFNTKDLNLTNGVGVDHCYNKLIFFYLKTRRYKYYTLNTMCIKLHKLSWIRNLTKSMKVDYHKINNHTIQYKPLQHNETQTYL